MRFILFLAIVGVVSQGFSLDKDNPAATVFHVAAGEVGLRIFGIVLWSAAISSVIGASYTSVSLLKHFIRYLQSMNDCAFLSLSFLQPVCLHLSVNQENYYLFAGAINGLILPVALSIILIAATKSRLMKGYKHPVWMQGRWLDRCNSYDVDGCINYTGNVQQDVSLGGE